MRKIICMLGIVAVASFVNTASIKFRLSARGLIPKEAGETDKPDPFAKVSVGSTDWGRTDTIENNQFPQWSKLFSINYNPGDKIHVLVQENDGGGGKDGEIGDVYVNPIDLDKEVERDIEGHGMIGGRLRFDVVP